MQFEGISAASQAVMQLYYTNYETLPEQVKTVLADLVGMTRSPVDAVVEAAEVLYANQDDLSDDVKEVAAALASCAAQHGYHGMDIDARGDLMSLIFTGKTLPSGVIAPVVNQKYAPSVTPVVLPETE